MASKLCLLVVAVAWALSTSRTTALAHAFNENNKNPKAVVSTDVPPLLDVPTYSLATRNSDGSTNMNILTYATPVSVRPDRIWSLGLFKGTQSHENFCRDGTTGTSTCILQLLTDDHIPVVKLLGGSSGKDVNKQEECSLLGLKWESLSQDETTLQSSPLMVLPRCAYYIELQLVGDIMDCGSHDMALCRVLKMHVVAEKDDGEGGPNGNNDYLSTAKLRELGIITAQGRVAED